jgi:hypothetical protein
VIIRAFAQMRQLQQAQPGISPRELLECVTTNAAGALRQSDALPGCSGFSFLLPFSQN